MNSKKPILITLTTMLVVLPLYASVVFIGQSLLFGIYQFLRDRGYGFWSSNALIATGFTIMALPSLYYRLLAKRQK